MARLVLTRENRTQEYELLDTTTLGRSSKSTIRVPEAKASRQHSRITKKGDTFVVEDMNSSNGTYVNKQKIQSPHILKSGDDVQIGKTHFMFVEIIDDPLVGTQLGNYEVIERLGKGGMGTVYRARQITMDRDVALKVMRPDFSRNPDFIKNFMREARLAGRLQHINVIHIHDFGEEKGHYFFSMEYVRGETVSDRLLRTGRMDPDEVVRLSTQIAEALAHAHENGVIHQDIKPENIMLAENDRVKVADLGLARAMTYGEVQDDKPVMGTPQYVAPEIIRRMPPDPRSDIYSLGATMFHMIVGRAPYGGDKATTIVKQHLEAPVPNPQEVRPNIPAALSQIIMSCMEKDPARRPADCNALIEQLRHLDLTAAPPKQPTQDRKPVVPLAPASVAAAPLAPKEPAQIKTHARPTDALPTANPWKPVAIGIMLLASILTAALLSFGLYQIFRGDTGETEATRLLHDAQQAYETRDYSRAEEILTQLRSAWPDAPEIAEAEPLLLEVRNASQIEADTTAKLDEIRKAYERKVLTTEQTKAELQKLMESPQTDPDTRRQCLSFLSELNSSNTNIENTHTPLGTLPAGTAAQKQQQQERARTAWTELEPVIERDLRQNKTIAAIEMLEAFLRNHPDTFAAETAAIRLQTLQQQQENVGRDIVEAGLRAKALGNLAEATQHFREAVETFKDAPWAKRAATEQAIINKELRTEYFRIWQEFRQNLKALKTGDCVTRASDLARKAKGMAWGNAAADLEKELTCLAAYRNILKQKLDETKEKLSVKGIGPANIQIDLRDTMTALSPNSDTPTPIQWSDIWLEDLYALAPANTITPSERIGAALHFLSRNHLGFMRTYLQSIPRNTTEHRLALQAIAHRQNRTVLEWFDFSDPLANQRWKPTEGAWAFENGSLGATRAIRSTAILTGNRFPLTNLAVSFQARTNVTSGQAALLLKVDDTHFIAARRTGEKLVLEFANGTPVPSRSETGVDNADIPLRLDVVRGRASIAAGSNTLAHIRVPGTQTWNASICLELNDTAGSFDDVLIMVGP